MKNIQNFILNGKQFLIDRYSIHTSEQALKTYQKQQYKENNFLLLILESLQVHSNKIIQDDENPNNFFQLIFSQSAHIKWSQHTLSTSGIQQHNLSLFFFQQNTKPQIIVQKSLKYEQQNERGDTPLHLASISGQCEIIKLLLYLKFNVDVENKEHLNLSRICFVQLTQCIQNSMQILLRNSKNHNPLKFCSLLFYF
ncbi:unnamed protein product [Paramecium sonneborni]|uniref:Ankyrin repeat protein n=1 Tax=Paramecium sonneborni TaxID=65129 RepID=A0A8S1Q062_9CILI|nr:unnamed protein product [Paramecium sonneborni]